MSIDDAAKALFVPFVAGTLAVPPPGARILWGNARDVPDRALLADCILTLQQSFRPWALPLMRAGLSVDADFTADADYDAVLVCGRKQHEENCALMAACLLRLKPGGIFVCAAENDAGGRRLAKDLAALGLQLESDSKYHCRIVYGVVDDFDRVLAQQWIDEAGPQQKDIDDTLTWTQPGLFGWDRLDKGSAFLLQHLPTTFRGKGADLGCGNGVLSRHLLRHNPGIKALTGLDADARAVEATLRNIPDERMSARWVAVGAEVTGLENLDWVVMNPPFHQGSKTAIAEGIVFIKAAAQMMHTGGHLWMVANAHLPYEAHITTEFKRCDKIAEAHGFKIYCAVK
jgi:16S rRNA (guanine1207-N2)-methyltransferase